MDWIKKIYKRCIDLLSTHSQLSLILSHGGLHLFVLVLLVFWALYLYHNTSKMNKIEVNSIYLYTHERTSNYEFNSLVGRLYLYPSLIDTSWIQVTNKLRPRFKSRDTTPSTSKQLSGGLTISIDSYSDLDKYYMLNQREDSIIFDGEFSVSSPKMKLINKHGELTNTIKVQARSKDTSSHDYPIVKIPGNEVFKDKSDKSATTAVWIGINRLEKWHSLSEKKWQYIDSCGVGDLEIIYCPSHEEGNLSTPFEIKTIIPEPDLITPFSIAYLSPQSQQRVLENRGIYIVIEDVAKKNKVELRTMQYTILIGAMIAFMLDIIVNLIIKWRRLAKSSKTLQSQNPK